MVIEVAIYDRSHPQGIVPTDEKRKALKQSLFEMMYRDLMSEADICPKFHGFFIAHRVLKVRAADVQSIECLVDMVERMPPPWPGAQICVDYRKEKFFVEALVPNLTHDLEDVLQHISRLNSKYQTNKWKTMGKRTLGEAMVYTFCIEPVAFELLKKTDGFIPYNDSQIEFRILKNPDMIPN